MKANLKILEAMYPFEYWLNKLPIDKHKDISQARTNVNEFTSMVDFITFGFVWKETKDGVNYWLDVIKAENLVK
jgi:hypothetical protein